MKNSTKWILGSFAGVLVIFGATYLVQSARENSAKAEARKQQAIADWKADREEHSTFFERRVPPHEKPVRLKKGDMIPGTEESPIYLHGFDHSSKEVLLSVYGDVSGTPNRLVHRFTIEGSDFGRLMLSNAFGLQKAIVMTGTTKYCWSRHTTAHTVPCGDGIAGYVVSDKRDLAMLED